MASNELYGTFGSVPDKVSVTGSGGSPLSVRADANDFGAQIGEAMQNLGAASAQVADRMSAQAKKEQDVINRTLTTQAEIKYASELAGLSVNYKSLPGLQSYEKLPEYTAQVAGLRQKYAETLPESARQEFDFIALNYEKSAIVDAHAFAAKAARDADLNASAEAIAMAQTRAGYKPVAQDDYRFGETLGDIHANVAKQFDDAPGVEWDSQTGYYKFADTPEAKQTEDAFNKAVDEATGKAWMSRFQTLMDDDPIGAFEKYQADREEIPSQFQIALDSQFYPRVRDAYASGVAGNVLKDAERGYSEAYAKTGKPDAVSVIMKNELHADGTIRVHADGDGQAIGGINSNAFPEQFAEASRILRDDGQDAARDYIKDFYQKEIIEARGIDNLPANVQEIVADGVVNHRTEIQDQLVAAAKNGASPQELVAMRRKEYSRLATENPAKYGQYVDAWNKRLDKFGVGDAGAIRPPTQADYYQQNYDRILGEARAAAEDQRPGDVSFANLSEQKTKNHLDNVIRQQNAQYAAASKKLYQASIGALTKGERPANMDAIKAMSPEMKNLVDDVMINQPQVYNTIDRQLRVAGNARNPKIPVEEQNRVYTEIFDEVAQWQLSTKKGKSVVGNQDIKDAFNIGDTSRLEDLIRIQNRITDETNRGVKGLRPLMNKITPAILGLVAKEQGADDQGWDWGSEQLEPYDAGYQVIQDYLEKQYKNSPIPLPLKAKMLSGFVRMADAIPTEIQNNPVEYKKALGATADFVINDVMNDKVAATRRLTDTPNFAYKDGELVEGLPGKRDLKPDTKVNDLEVKMQVDGNGNKAKVYFRDGKRVKAEILDKDGNVAKEVLF